MKIFKIQKGDSKVTRKLISNFGESVYRYPEVKSVIIKVNFKDGSTLGFKRDEEEDTFHYMIKQEYEKYEECDDKEPEKD